MAFSLIKPFLNEYTLGKIYTFRGDKKKYLAELLKVVEKDQIPKYFGGTQVDENGDEKCSSKVQTQKK